MVDETTYNDDTLFKVAVALREAGLTETQIDDSINSLQNYGILFRERIEPSMPSLF